MKPSLSNFAFATAVVAVLALTGCNTGPTATLKNTTENDVTFTVAKTGDVPTGTPKPVPAGGSASLPIPQDADLTVTATYTTTGYQVPDLFTADELEKGCAKQGGSWNCRFVLKNQDIELEPYSLAELFAQKVTLALTVGAGLLAVVTVGLYIWNQKRQKKVVNEPEIES